MAVYTEVADDQLDAFLAEYDIGEPQSCKGIAEGVENSNYLLATTRGTYFLTLYEKRVDPRDLPFFLGLMDHLAARGIPCPTPVHGRDGRALRTLAGRPAAIITFLSGLWPRRITVDHCAPVGAAMARLHLAAADFTLKRPNALSVAGWRPLFDSTRMRAHEVAPGLADELAADLAVLERDWPRDLPAGVIHADLFQDNVLFLHETLSGVIDFYFACNDLLAYDVAICLNAWCFEADRSFNVTKARALVSGYQQVRPLSAAERHALPLLARGAAMRFLLTRLYDWLHTPPGAMVKRKDPLEYLARLRFHRGAGGPDDYGL
ncbi:homoserine kinase [Reyranella sp. CPCC 100927]|uniref:homoserine kinase n=1 Tax=Reyranella sp. CPCC 100927 TaxID=2599616 RepID=UPI0011B83F0E|nr:homoserine kinase [Reyranella sp. CPCC 100927]TWS97098.1 homoserine kinase [Reyranella sp. CPCC 100927]